ncbi:MAG: hypothetical protein AAF378_02945 [Cyanobacteria bacterium P01_A01_bin.84]
MKNDPLLALTLFKQDLRKNNVISSEATVESISSVEHATGLR